MRLIAILLLVISLPAFALAQGGTISGTVTDAQTGEVLPGVNVVIAGTFTGTSTQANGEYRLENINVGTVSLRFTFIGYEDVVRSGIRINSGETLTVDVAMSAISLQTDEVIVTGTRRPQKIVDAPLSIERISAQQIANTAGTTPLYALSGIKGVDFVDAGINAQGISARGFNNQFNTRLLAMVDGRMAQLPGTGLPQGNFLPNAGLDIQSVEVVLGPASALYGPNAHTGVINIITKTPWNRTGLDLDVRAGGNELLDFNGRAAFLFNNNLGFKITGQYMTAQDFEPRERDLTHFYNTLANGQVGPNSVFEADLLDDYSVSSQKVDASLYYRAGDWQLVASSGYSYTDTFGLTNNGRNHIRGWTVNYQSLQLSSSNWYAQATRTGNDAGDTYQLNGVAGAVSAQLAAGIPFSQIDLEALRAATGFTDKAQMYDAELQYNNQIGDLSFVTGLQYRYYDPNSEGTFLADANNEDISATEFGGYLQLEYPVIRDRLNATVAARLDDHSNYDLQFSPKAALVYTIAPNHNARITYNRAFKSPTVLENNIFINLVGGPGYGLAARGNIGGYELRNPDGSTIGRIDPLSPEEVNSFELGYIGSFRNGLFVDVNAYYSFYNNFISPLTFVANGIDVIPFDDAGNQVSTGDPLTGLLTYINFGEAEVRGIDISIGYQLNRNISVSGTASFIELVDFTIDEGSPIAAELLLNVPTAKYRFAVNTTDLITPGTFANLSGRYTRGYDFASGYWNSQNLIGGNIPERFVADLVLGYAIPNTGVNVKTSVSNLFDNERVDVLGAPVRGRLIWFSVGYSLSGLRF